MRLTPSFTLAPLAGLLGLALAPTSCQELEPIALNRCGNQVVENELGEDCDGLSAIGTCSNYDAQTNTAIDDGLCRFVCDPKLFEEEGCPADMGYECGSDGVCRRPSRTFELGTSIDGVATRLVAKELGDGVDRATELLAFDGQTLRVFRFDEDGRVLDTQRIPAQGTELAIGDFTSAFNPSLALRYEASTSSVGVSLFDIAFDGTLSAVTIKDEKLAADADADEKSIFIDASGRNPLPEELLLKLDERGIQLFDFESESYRQVITQNLGEQSFGGVATGEVFGGTAICDEVAIGIVGAPGGDDEVRVFPLCQGASFNTPATDADVITLPSALSLFVSEDVDDRVRRPSVFFINAPDGGGITDALPDVLIYATPDGEDGILLLARQRIPTVMDPRRFEDPEVFPFNGKGCQGSSDEEITEQGRPLALADFNGDGVDDVIAEGRVQVSRPNAAIPDFVATVCGDFRWHAVEVADLTGDGALDVVVQEQASETNDDNPGGPPTLEGTSLIALINDGTGAFTQFRITSDSVADFEVADFDGDGVADIAYAFEDSIQGSSSVFVSYGQASGGPAPAVVAAEFDAAVVELASGRFKGSDGAADLVVVTFGADPNSLEVEEPMLSHHVLIGSGTRQLIAPVLLEETREGETYEHTPVSLLSTQLPPSLVPDVTDPDLPLPPPDVLATVATWRRRDEPTNTGDRPPPVLPSVWATSLADAQIPVSEEWVDDNDANALEAGDEKHAVSLDINPGDDDGEEVVVITQSAKPNDPGKINIYEVTAGDAGPKYVQRAQGSLDLVPDPESETFASAPDPLVVDVDGDGLDDILFFSRQDKTNDGEGDEDVEFDDIAFVELTLLRNTGTNDGFEAYSVLLFGLRSEGKVLAPALAEVQLSPGAPPEVVVIGFELEVLRFADGALTTEIYGENPFFVPPQSAAAGDFNGDGVDDIAIANGNQIEVLLGIDQVDPFAQRFFVFQTGAEPIEPTVE